MQSSVDASGGREAGGLQYTSQQLGSSVGVELVGAVVTAGLAAGFVSIVSDDERIPTQVVAAVTIEMSDGAEMVAADELAVALEDTDLDQEIQAALVEDYQKAQLQALRTGLVVSAIVAFVALMYTRELPSRRPEPGQPPVAEDDQSVESADAHAAADRAEASRAEEGAEPNGL